MIKHHEQVDNYSFSSASRLILHSIQRAQRARAGASTSQRRHPRHRHRRHGSQAVAAPTPGVLANLFATFGMHQEERRLEGVARLGGVGLARETEAGAGAVR